MLSEAALENAGTKVQNHEQVVDAPKSFSEITLPEGVSLFTPEAYSMEQPEQDVRIQKQEQKEEIKQDAKKESKEKESPKEEEKTDGKSLKEETKSGEVKTYSLGDEEFTEEQLREAIKDSKNKKEWQKSNTEKAQEIANTRKALEPLVQLVQKLKDNGETVADIKTIVTDALGDESAQLVDYALKFDSSVYQHPEVAELREQLTQREANDFIRDELRELRDTHGLTQEQAEEVQAWAVDKFDKTKQAYSLEDSYMLMNFKTLEEKAKEQKKEIKQTKQQLTSVTKQSAGAKTFEQQQTVPTRYKDIVYDPAVDGQLFSS